MQTALTNGAPRASALKTPSSLLKAAGEGDIRYPFALVRQLLAELVGGGMQVEAGHTPLLHHAPGAHAGAAGSAVYRQQVDFGSRAPLDGHGQLAQAVSAGFQGDALEADIPQPLDLVIEVLFSDKAEPAVPFELLDGAFLEGCLVDRVGGVGRNDIAAFLELQRPLQAVDLDFAADTLGALPPFQLDGFQAVLLMDIFGHAQSGILDVHLDQDFTVALVIAAVGLDAAVHIRGRGDLALVIALQLGVDAADIFAADQSHAADSRPDGEVLPVFAGYLGGAQGAGKNGHLHFDLDIPAVFRLGVYRWESGRIRVAFDPLGQPSGSQGIPLDIEVRVIDRVVFIAAGGNFAEGPG